MENKISNEINETIVYGINPVMEVLNASYRRIYKIIIAEKKGGKESKEIIEKAKTYNIPIRIVPNKQISIICGNNVSHQGIVAYLAKKDFLDIYELVDNAFKRHRYPLIILLDNMDDPRNLGAIIRSAAGFNIDGVILIKDRCVGLTPSVYKTSAGAAEMIPIARVTNSSNTINLLKEKGFIIVGIDLGSDIPCYNYKFDSPAILVLGGESKGIRRLTLKNCDQLIKIPISEKISSYNVSVAAAIIFYEATRQHQLMKIRHF